MGIFAGLSLLLAVVGIYGVLSYLVTQRRQEIGVRMALGAGRADVQRMVVKQGMVLAGGGITMGVMAALFLSRWLQSLVFEVKATDPWVFGLGIVVLGGIALLAAYLPSRRAARVDPATAFRAE